MNKEFEILKGDYLGLLEGIVEKIGQLNTSTIANEWLTTLHWPQISAFLRVKTPSVAQLATLREEYVMFYWSIVALVDLPK